jgi:hypothetical protein
MAIKGQPLINGTAYTHADIVLNVLGIPIVEVTEIAYSDPQSIEFNYGTGNEPVSRSYGNVEPTASITVAMKEFEKIKSLSPTGRIQDIPDFPIGVNYSPEGQDFRRDQLLFCRFKGADVSSSQGNTNTYVTLEISVARILYNV